MDEVIKLIKKRMVEAGRDDFTKYLSEILNISRTAASNKLNGHNRFSLRDIAIIDKELNFTQEEINEIVKGAS